MGEWKEFQNTEAKITTGAIWTEIVGDSTYKITKTCKNVDDYKKARCAVTKEVLSMIVIQLVTNLAFLTPTFITGRSYITNNLNYALHPQLK